MPITALRPTLLGALTPALALLLGLPSTEARALGLGRPVLHSVLGKPLDLSVPLTLADGEQLGESCLRAEVSAGEARVPAGLLQLRIEGEPGQRRIRLQSQARIEEPALRVTLALGCPLRLTREFNVLVDPQDGAAPPPAPLPPAPVALPPPVVEVTPPAPPPKPRPRVRPRASGPRLTLERPEVLVAEAPARPASTAPELLLTPELEAQISQLEQTVAQLRADLLARRQSEAQAAVGQAIPAGAAKPAAALHSPRPSPYRDPMTWVLTLALSLLAGAAAFHFGRWRDERARRELAYWRALHAAEGAGLPPPPPVPPGMAPPVAGPAAALPDEGQHQITKPQPRPMQATQPLPPDEAALADALLDLQQQVDFLLLLGQHEAAAELLSAHMAHGRAGAMPGLLLMELSQQRGDADAFADTGRQLAQRFGTPAPAWAQRLSAGRGLDACPSAIAHLQMVWAGPEAAMTLLQEWLARGGGPGVPHFELPAWRDLLTLYGVARELFEAGLCSGGVDLVLPLDS